MGRSNTTKQIEITGSILEKRGHLHMVFCAGFDEDGKRLRKSLSTGLVAKNNKRKAESICNELTFKLNEIHKLTGIYNLEELVKIASENELSDVQEKVNKESDCFSQSSMLFSDVVAEWLRYRKTRVMENTYVKYNHAAVDHIIPYFKQREITIDKISPADIVRYLTEKQEGDTVNGKKGLNPTTLAAHKTVINGTTEYAKKILRVISSDPSLEVAAPKKSIRAPSFYTQSQLNTVLELVRGEPMESAVVLTANYGLRRGEVLGLKWSAVDFKNKTITVRHTVTQVGTKIVCADRAKNTASLRTFDLTEQVERYLKRLYAHQKSMQALCKKSYNCNDYICKWDDGRQLRPDYVTESWRLFLRKNSLPHIRFHDLRHSSASLLLAMGFTLKDVQEWLGQANIKSANLYAHLTVQAKKIVAQKVNDALVIDSSVSANSNKAEEQMAI